jgi:predicted aspartyl protease
MQVKPLDSVHSLPFVFFDDTGATNPTIYPEDLQALGIHQDYVGWSFPLTYNTANGSL